MAPNAAKSYPFMTCIIKVDTRSNWQRTVRKVLEKCNGVGSFRMDDNGTVEISGTVDPNLLLKMLGKAGRSAELSWFQFGECSSNLYMQPSYGRDGRYLHAADTPRPTLPHYYSLSQQQDYYHQYPATPYYNYDHHYDQYQSSGGAYGHTHASNQIANPSSASPYQDNECCIVM